MHLLYLHLVMFKNFIKKLTHSPTSEMKVVQKQKKRSNVDSLWSVVDSTNSTNGLARNSSEETVDSCESVKLDTPSSSSVHNLFSSATDLDASSFSMFPQDALIDSTCLEKPIEKMLARVVDVGVEFIKMLPQSSHKRQFVVRRSDFDDEPVLNVWYACKGAFDLKCMRVAEAQITPAEPLFVASSPVTVSKSRTHSVSTFNKDHSRMSYHGFVLQRLHDKYIAWVCEEQEEMSLSLPDNFKLGDWFEYCCLTKVYAKCSTQPFESRQVDGVWQMLVPVVSPSELDAELMSDDLFDPIKSIWSPAFGPIIGCWPAHFRKDHFVNVWITRASLESNSETKGNWTLVEEDNEPVPSTTLEIAKCFFALPTACFIGGIVVRRVGKTSVILSEHGQLCYCCCPDHHIGDHVEFIVWPMACSLSTFNIAVNCLVFCEKWLEPGAVRDEFLMKKSINKEQVSSKQCNHPGLGTIHDIHHLLHHGLVDVDMVVGFERLISPDACSPSFQWVIKRLVNSSALSMNNSGTSSTSHHSSTINSSNKLLTHTHKELTADEKVGTASQPNSIRPCSEPDINGTASDTKKTVIGVVLRVTSTLVCLYSPDLALPKFFVPVKSFKGHPQPSDWYNLCVPYPVLGHKSKCGNIVLKGIKAKVLQEEPPLKTFLMESVVMVQFQLKTEVCVGNPTSTGLRYCYSQPFPVLLDSTGLLSDYKVGERALAWCVLRNFKDGPVYWNIVLMDSNKSCTTDPLVVQQEENQSISQNVPSPSPVEVEEEAQVITDDQVGLVCSTAKNGFHVYCTSTKSNGILKKTEDVKLGDWITFSAKLVNGVLRISKYKLMEPIERAMVTASQLLLPCEIKVPLDFKVSNPGGDKVVSDLICPIYDSNKLIGPENVGMRMKVMVACNTISQSLNQFKWTIVHLQSG